MGVIEPCQQGIHKTTGLALRADHGTELELSEIVEKGAGNSTPLQFDNFDRVLGDATWQREDRVLT